MLPKIEIFDIQSECLPKTPTRILEIICEYRKISVEALEKINIEGTVVRTLKGDVISHPAIKIHSDATKSEFLILKEWAKKTMPKSKSDRDTQSTGLSEEID